MPSPPQSLAQQKTNGELLEQRSTEVQVEALMKSRKEVCPEH